MNLDIIKSTILLSKWRDAKGSVSLSFEVRPQGREYIEIGDEYLFSGSSWRWLHGKERILVNASVSVTDNPEYITHLEGLFPEKERPICGCASFYPERQGSLDYTPAGLQFDMVAEPHLFAEMLRSTKHSPGGATLNLSLEGLDYGWEPDASHLIWKLAEGTRDRRPVTSFSYRVERFWTTEGAIRRVNDRKVNDEMADSPDPEVRKLAEVLTEQGPAATIALLKECRALLIAILIVGVIAIVRFRS